jgi:hypothetical protein
LTKNLLVSSVVLTAALALTGCSSISSTLGLERHIPDESQVTVHPALTLPPDFDLKPPGTETAVSADHEGAASNATAEGVATAPAQKPEEERGFFGKLFHGDFFGNDVDATTHKPDDKGPDVNGTPQAPPPDKPAADASAPAAPAPATPPASPDVNGTPQPDTK